MDSPDDCDVWESYWWPRIIAECEVYQQQRRDRREFWIALAVRVLNVILVVSFLGIVTWVAATVELDDRPSRGGGGPQVPYT